MAQAARPSVELDTETPAPSRVYNRLLGGDCNFAADRTMADELVAAQPEAVYWAVSNRQFLTRAVRHVLDAGVRQVLDIGCGLPATIGGVHEIAWAVAPETRVALVDVDPVVVSHAQQVLGGHAGTTATAVWGDLRDPDAILDDPRVTAVVDVARPVAVLLGAVLHFVADSDDPAGILARLRDRVAAGSYLVISHADAPERISAAQRRAVAVYAAHSGALTLRSRQRVTGLLTGWRVLPPGVVRPPFWNPEPTDLDDPADAARAARVPGWVAVARKPHAEQPGAQR